MTAAADLSGPKGTDLSQPEELKIFEEKLFSQMTPKPIYLGAESKYKQNRCLPKCSRRIGAENGPILGPKLVHLHLDHALQKVTAVGLEPAAVRSRAKALAH